MTLLLSLCANFATAQEPIDATYRGPIPRHEVSVSYGTLPITNFVGIFSNLFVGVFTGKLSNISSIGATSLNYLYRINKTIGVGATFSFSSLNADVRNTEDVISQSYYSIMPQIKFNWLNRDLVTLYSRLNVGVTYLALRRTYEAPGSESQTGCVWAPMFQLSPIGIEVGRRIAGYAEAGWGATGLLIVGIRGKF